MVFFSEVRKHCFVELIQKLALLVMTLLRLGTAGGAVVVRAFVLEHLHVLARQAYPARGTERDVRQVCWESGGITPMLRLSQCGVRFTAGLGEPVIRTSHRFRNGQRAVGQMEVFFRELSAKGHSLVAMVEQEPKSTPVGNNDVIRGQFARRFSAETGQQLAAAYCLPQTGATKEKVLDLIGLGCQQVSCHHEPPSICGGRKVTPHTAHS